MRYVDGIVIVMMSLLGVLVSMALASSIATAETHYVDVDWEVTEDTTLCNDTWYISGNLTVANCTLTLERAWLRMYNDFWSDRIRLHVRQNASLVANSSRITLMGSHSMMVLAGDVRCVNTTLDGYGDSETIRSINQTGGSLTLERCFLDLRCYMCFYASLVVRDCTVSPRSASLCWMPEGYCARSPDGRRHTALIERTRFGDGTSQSDGTIALGYYQSAPSGDVAWGDWAAIVRNCTFISCNLPIGVGGNNRLDYSVLIENNTAVNTTYYGIRIDEGGRILVRNNRWHQMDGGNAYGLSLRRIQAGWEPVFENDTIEGGSTGISVFGSPPGSRPTIVFKGQRVLACSTGVVVNDAEVDFVGGQVYGAGIDFHVAEGGAVHLLGCAHGQNCAVDYYAVELSELWPMYPGSITWNGICPIAEGTVRFIPEVTCRRSLLNCSDPREVWLAYWSTDPASTHVQSDYTPSMEVDGLTFLGSTFDLVYGGSFDVVIHDDLMPVLDLATPVDGGIMGDASILVSGNCTDLGAGLEWVGVSLDGGPWLRVEGWAGAMWCTTLEGVPEGTHSLWVRAVDRAGNIAQTAMVVFIVDSTPPTIELLDVPSHVRCSPVTVRLGTEPDATAYVDGIEVQVDAEGHLVIELDIAPGANTFHVKVVDRAGRVAETDFTILFDTEPPYLLVYCPLEDSYTNGDSIVVEGMTELDATVLVDNASIEVVKGHFITYLPLGEGEHLITVKAYDTVGNLVVVGIEVTVDRTPPIIIIESPREGLVTSDETICVSGLIDERWLDRVESPSGAVTASIDTWMLQATLCEGLNSIEVVAYDRAGNIGRASVAVTRDTLGPDITALLLVDGSELRPGDAQAVTGSPVATLHVTACERCTVSLDGQADVELDAEGWRTEVQLHPGLNTIILHSLDALGNAGNDSIFLVLRDVEPPHLTVIEPRAKARLAKASITVRGLTEIGARVTVNGIEAEVDPTGNFSAQVGLDHGSNKIQVVAADICGNEASVTVWVSRTRPTDWGDVVANAVPIATLVAVAGLLGVLALLLLLRRSASRARAQGRARAGHPPDEPVEGTDGTRLGSHVRRRGG